MNMNEVNQYRDQKEYLMRNGDKMAPRNTMMEDRIDGNEGVDYPSHGVEQQ
jgi:hypothetical protein